MTDLTPRQARLLKLSYGGLNPFVYSRYGRRQWAAPFPGTRIIVKDPFAMLSIPAIVAATRAVPLVVYRHPAAVLASYRRMGWSPDLDEIGVAIPETLDSTRLQRRAQQDTPIEDGADDALQMAHFWSAVNRQALVDLKSVEHALVVAHEDVAAGGMAAMRRLFELVGLQWTPAVEQALQTTRVGGERPSDPTALHNFGRRPGDVAEAWRADVSESDLAVLEYLAGPTLRELNARRAVLG